MIACVVFILSLQNAVLYLKLFSHAPVVTSQKCCPSSVLPLSLTNSLDGVIIMPVWAIQKAVFKFQIAFISLNSSQELILLHFLCHIINVSLQSRNSPLLPSETIQFIYCEKGSLHLDC